MNRGVGVSVKAGRVAFTLAGGLAALWAMCLLGFYLRCCVQNRR